MDAPPSFAAPGAKHVIKKPAGSTAPLAPLHVPLPTQECASAVGGSEEASTSTHTRSLDEISGATQAAALETAPAREDADLKNKLIQNYTPPAWSGRPAAAFTLEVLKGGSIVEERDVSQQAYYTFGRHPSSHVTLEHPSCSRLHAVLQFKDGDAREAYLWDAGSTHGTFVNKHRLKAGVYAPLRVGDQATSSTLRRPSNVCQVRFGQSSRTHVLSGPAELMPEEGLSKTERAQLRHLEAMAAQQEEASIRAMQKAKVLFAQREAAGAGWGQDLSEAEDYAERPQAGAGASGGALEWRTYEGKLTEKQEKLKERLVRRDLRLGHLKAEIVKIQAKQGQEGGLTPGQQLQVARNEQVIETLEEELEALGEQLEESIAEGLSAREGGGEGPAGALRKRKAEAEAEGEAGGGSDSDEFYDRTAPARKHRTGKTAAGAEARPAAKEAAPALTIAEIWRQCGDACADREALQARLDEAERAAAAAAAATAREAAGGAGAAAAAEGEDALDSFMTSVSHDIDASRVTSLRTALAAKEADIARLQKLKRLADYSGAYKGPKAPSAPPAAVEEAAVPGHKLVEEPSSQPEQQPLPKQPQPQQSPPQPLQLQPHQPQQPQPQQPHPQGDRGAAGAGGRGLGKVLSAIRGATFPRPSAQARGAAEPSVEAKVEADLQRLMGGGAGAAAQFSAEQDEDEEAVAEWTAPAGQSGDGRTSLNAKLGY